MRRYSVKYVLLAVALAFGFRTAAADVRQPQKSRESPESAPLLLVAADHHLHVQGPRLTAALKKVASERPDMFRGFNPDLLKERTGDDAIRVLDEARIRTGVLLSEAYMFTSPIMGFKIDERKAALETRSENLFDVDAARNSGGRLVAFIGINPLAANAGDELHYWAHKRGVSGIKLHLANSGFHPQRQDEVEKLAKFFDEARKVRLPIIVHVRNAEEYGPNDVRQFIDKVLPHAGTLPIQIAHSGGWGGLDEPTLMALSAYAAAIRQHAPGTENLFFDLAAVVTKDKTDSALLNRLVALMREIGLSRFVMGSDWPATYTPQEYNTLLGSKLPLTRDEWLVILSNRAPWT